NWLDQITTNCGGTLASALWLRARGVATAAILMPVGTALSLAGYINRVSIPTAAAVVPVEPVSGEFESSFCISE
ncbi:MAG: hypothetical protein ABJF23_31870, partial [Bryobacteraceae bacterium]